MNIDSLPSTPAALLPYCRDCRNLQEWPERWMGVEEDLRQARGSSNVSCPSCSSRRVRPVEKNHPKSRRQYVGARRRKSSSDLNEDHSLRTVAAEQLIRNVIHEDGGPLIHKRLGRRAALLRLHLPQGSTASSLELRAEPPVTHRFPGRAIHSPVAPPTDTSHTRNNPLVAAARRPTSSAMYRCVARTSECPAWRRRSTEIGPAGS